jgi:hypothetical protein
LKDGVLSGKRYSPKEIVRKLRETDLLSLQELKVGEVVRRQDDEDALITEIVDPATRYGLCGYRRATAPLNAQGWRMRQHWQKSDC